MSVVPNIVTVTLNPAIDQTISVPNFAIDAVNRVTWEQADPGGKGINVSSFLADFGLASTATGLLGRENPELFERLFAQKGIRDRCLRIAGKTRVNVKIVDDIQRQVTDLNFPGQSPTPQDLEDFSTTLNVLVADQDFFVLAGSTPNGIPTGYYHDLIQRLKQSDKTVVLDTSGDRLRAAIAAKPDVIKPNVAELREIWGQPLASAAAIVQAARDLIQQGLRLVVVSMGADGALFVDDRSAVHAQPPSVEVKSTVGAGDAMVAGTVTGLVQGQSLEECARLGTAFSMGALTQIGPRLPPKATILENCDRVTVQSI
ncbi:1-phosphofructokinase [Vacuolonema iberomarrocanum]|uniref:1-phosphofructokinase n=1 Tax=Vacuolonema iberomarrocanum TaxID=3454632 RepID=UPI0019EACD8C|nr:1-phosphofructokinase [filamentous cyanobacterium LEGE 07170]